MFKGVIEIIYWTICMFQTGGIAFVKINLTFDGLFFTLSFDGEGVGLILFTLFLLVKKKYFFAW